MTETKNPQGFGFVLIPEDAHKIMRLRDLSSDNLRRDRATITSASHEGR